MKRRVFMVGVALAALVTGSAGAVAATTPATPNTGARSLDDTVTARIVERGTAQGVRQAAGEQVNVQRSVDGWAFGSAVLLAPRREGAAPTAWLFVAQQDGDDWQVALDGEPGFGPLVARAPEKVVSRGEKRTFARNIANARERSATPGTPRRQEPTGLSLPYPIDTEWRIIGGLHGWSGQARPWSSIDLDSRADNREVLAAQSGRAYWMCENGGHIRIVHDNGWTTEYYHLLDEIRPDGYPIAMGDYLGLTSTRIPCGGSAGSNHVHFALKKDGDWVPLADKTIGGWTYFEGDFAYDGGGCRGDDCRYTGDWLRNYGPETAG